MDCIYCKFANEHHWWGPDMPPNQTHCRRCHKNWSGQTAVHCTICHETFASQASSDLHENVRPRGKKGGHGKHVHPSTVKALVPVERADGWTYWTKG